MKNLINLKADSKLIGTVYNIYNHTGKVVFSGIIDDEITSIEMENLPGGSYILSFGDNMRYLSKIIIQ